MTDVEENQDEVKQEEERCPCPDVYPDWDGQSINLSGFCVHEMGVPSIFHMPVSFDMYVSKQAYNVQDLELTELWPGLVLSKTGMWGGKIIRLLKDSESSASRLVHHLPSPFDVMVQMHEGGVGTVPKAVHKMQIAMVEKGCMPKEFYLAHLTCPACCDRKGGDKILIFRRYVANERVKQNLEKESKRLAAKAEKSIANTADKKMDKKQKPIEAESAN